MKSVLSFQLCILLVALVLYGLVDEIGQEFIVVVGVWFDFANVSISPFQAVKFSAIK